LLTKIILLLTNLLSATHRIGISGQDVVINDINKPYNQNEIQELANLRAFTHEFGEVTNYIILVENNYENNEKKEGVYEQKYTIDLEGYQEYYYVLLIYNINFNKSDSVETISIVSTPNNFLSENNIISEIIKKLNIKIYNYQLIEGNYDESSSNGTYYQTYLVTTTNGERINVLVEIKVSNKNNNYLYLGIGILIVVTIITIIIFSKRKRVKNNV